MRRVGQFFVMFVITLGQLPIESVASATSAPPVAIRSLMTADSYTANGKKVSVSDDELVELENLTGTDLDVTNWRLQYINSGGTVTKLVDITADTASGQVYIPAHARETIFSPTYIVSHPLSSNYLGALRFASSAYLSGTSGTVQLLDNSQTRVVVDSIKWGPSSDTTAAIAPSDTQVLRRVGYTGSMRSDFAAISWSDQAFGYATLYSVADACPNITEFQSEPPSGYGVDTSGNCVSLDVCPNLEGTQLTIPDGLEIYRGICQSKFLPVSLQLTELLANPSGVDTGNEFLELYNPSETTVDLSDYYLMIGDKKAVFPSGLVIAPQSFKALSDLELGVVFPNTTGVSVTVLDRNDTELATMPAYANADIDMAWGLIDGAWQYTDQPTPGQQNLASEVDQPSTGDITPIACAEGYYRSPDTNRCRKITAAEVQTPCKPTQYRSEETGRCRNYATISAPTPCKDGQYRSEETGRCRSLALAVAAQLKPCSDDQFRNPATGRCKKIASTEDMLQPCQSGWERNPDTNRCRKIKVTDMPVAGYPVRPYSQTNTIPAMWWGIAGVACGALCYGAWEWRREVANGLQKVRQVISRGRW